MRRFIGDLLRGTVDCHVEINFSQGFITAWPRLGIASPRPKHANISDHVGDTWIFIRRGLMVRKSKVLLVKSGNIAKVAWRQRTDKSHVMTVPALADASFELRNMKFRIVRIFLNFRHPLFYLLIW